VSVLAPAAGRRPAGLAEGRPRTRWLPPAWAITALLGAAYLIAAPPSADLAAASYRSDLFGRLGFTLWDNGWYGGHHLPAYSVFAPALGWLIGPRLVAVLSLIGATALFAALIADRFPLRATRIAGAWFAVGASVALLSCRVPFDLGLAAGLGALLLAKRPRAVPAIALAAACSLASPVAGAFLALAAIAWAIALPPARLAVWLALAALAPIALLALAFPEGGFQPFVGSAFYPALAGVLLIAALIPPDGPLGEAPAPRTPGGAGASPPGARSGGRPAGRRVQARAGARTVRVLRTGALLYAAALVGAYLIRTPVGGNVDRLGALIAGPVAACLLAGGSVGEWRVRALVLLAPLLLYWQCNAPVADFRSAIADPAVNASYYGPLLRELRALGVGYDARPARIEVVPTADHWEARFLAPHIPIARGWERQLDNERNALFYGAAREPDAARYAGWLRAQAISLVALPDAQLDYSGRAEGRLLRGPTPPYLREVWRSRHWRLFAVLAPGPLATPPSQLVRLGADSFTLWAPRAGRYTVRVHFTPYWSVARGRGCVARAAGDWTALDAPRAGRVDVVIAFSLERVFDHGRRCG
jgi:hypothetical protein